MRPFSFRKTGTGVAPAQIPAGGVASGGGGACWEGGARPDFLVGGAAAAQCARGGRSGLRGGRRARLCGGRRSAVGCRRAGTMASGGAAGGAGRRTLHSARAEDVASASSFRDFEVLHLHLDLRAEFASRTLSGSAVLDLRCLVPAGAAELRLDSHPSLEVTAAALRRGALPGPEEPVRYHTRPFARYGCALCLSFPRPLPEGERFQVLLTYRVGDAGPGVSVAGVAGRPPPRERPVVRRPPRPPPSAASSSRQAALVSSPRRPAGSAAGRAPAHMDGPSQDPRVQFPFCPRKEPCTVRFLHRTRALQKRNCRSRGLGAQAPSKGPLGFCLMVAQPRCHRHITMRSPGKP